MTLCCWPDWYWRLFIFLGYGIGIIVACLSLTLLCDFVVARSLWLDIATRLHVLDHSIIPRWVDFVLFWTSKTGSCHVLRSELCFGLYACYGTTLCFLQSVYYVCKKLRRAELCKGHIYFAGSDQWIVYCLLKAHRSTLLGWRSTVVDVHSHRICKEYTSMRIEKLHHS